MLLVVTYIVAGVVVVAKVPLVDSGVRSSDNTSLSTEMDSVVSEASGVPVMALLSSWWKGGMIKEKKDRVSSINTIYEVLRMYFFLLILVLMVLLCLHDSSILRNIKAKSAFSRFLPLERRSNVIIYYLSHRAASEIQ